jgi:hypothetical protein
MNLFVILPLMPRRIERSRKPRPPRIRVPQQQRAVFTVDNQKFVGTVHRLSLTGGSALLAKGPIPEGTVGEITFGTVFGKVNAHIEFLHTGADGIPLAQAFAFLAMDDVSSKRFKTAVAEMQSSDLSDVVKKPTPIDTALETVRGSIRQLSGMLAPGRRPTSKS